MAEANTDHHPTAGRRRRHKSPPILHAPFAIPAPFEEGADPEYHDANEDPNVLESGENKREADLSHGGCGSSPLRECIELLN